MISHETNIQIRRPIDFNSSIIRLCIQENEQNMITKDEIRELLHSTESFRIERTTSSKSGKSIVRTL